MIGPARRARSSMRPRVTRTWTRAPGQRRGGSAMGSTRLGREPTLTGSAAGFLTIAPRQHPFGQFG